MKLKAIARWLYDLASSEVGSPVSSRQRLLDRSLAGSDWSSGLGLLIWASGGLELEFWNLATTKLAAVDMSVGRHEFMSWM